MPRGCRPPTMSSAKSSAVSANGPPTSSEEPRPKSRFRAGLGRIDELCAQILGERLRLRIDPRRSRHAGAEESFEDEEHREQVRELVAFDAVGPRLGEEPHQLLRG